MDFVAPKPLSLAVDDHDVVSPDTIVHHPDLLEPLDVIAEQPVDFVHIASPPPLDHHPAPADDDEPLDVPSATIVEDNSTSVLAHDDDDADDEQSKHVEPVEAESEVPDAVEITQVQQATLPPSEVEQATLTTPEVDPIVEPQAEAGAADGEDQTAINAQLDATSRMFSFMEEDTAFFGNSTSTSRFETGDSAAQFLYTPDESIGLDDYAGSESPPMHETDSVDGGMGCDSGEGGAQEGRVEASTMGVVDNPLQKRGRHTVITGHLPHDNPYAVAERQLGIKMCSLKMQATGAGGISRAEAFARDLQQFLVEISLTGYKVPVIGGGPLDLFALMREVLLLGGVTNVVKKRAFRIVGQQLELPKSCTSAAFVLKNAYTRLLYYYERKLVFDVLPDNPARNVNIKQIVAADKERDRMEAKMRTSGGAGAKRRLTQPLTTSINTNFDEEALAPPISLLPYESPKRARVEEATPLGAAVDYEISQDFYMSLVANYEHAVDGKSSAVGSGNSNDYVLPEWARTRVSDAHYQAFVDAAHALDERREVRTPIDAILVCAAHCFTPSTSVIAPGINACVAAAILRQHAVEWRAQLAVLIDVVGTMISSPACPPLADNAAAHALIAAFNHLVLQYTAVAAKSTEQPRVAAAYLAVALLETLAIHPANCALIAHHPETPRALAAILVPIGSAAPAKLTDAARDLLERIADAPLPPPTVERYAPITKWCGSVLREASSSAADQRAAVATLVAFGASASDILPACEASLRSNVPNALVLANAVCCTYPTEARDCRTLITELIAHAEKPQARHALQMLHNIRPLNEHLSELRSAFEQWPAPAPSPALDIITPLIDCNPKASSWHLAEQTADN